MKRLIVSMILASLSCGVYAENQPLNAPRDSRVKLVSYTEDNVVPINGKVFTTTQIVFGKDEYIKTVQGGDTAAWEATYKKEVPNMLFIKPTMLDSNSNMTVVTSKHNYYFKVKSNKALNADDHNVTYAIKFLYPIDERNRLNARLKRQQEEKESLLNLAKNPKAYNWNYRFSGNKQIMPLHVFDDGTFTYFELRKNQAVPAIFAVDDSKGKESVVNTRREGNYLIVQRLAPQFTLRNGETVASIFNANEIYKIKTGRG